MKRFSAVWTSVLTLAMVSTSVGQTIYSNGGIVTNPGAGSFGADVSQASVTANSGGSSAFLSGAGPGFRIADNFTVPVGETWTVTSISNLLYITSTLGTYGNPPASPITSINMNIWNGNPSLGGSSIVASSTALGTATWTNIYRTFNGTLVNDQRPVFDVQTTFPSIVLTSGTYYMDIQAAGTSPNGTTTVFMPFVMTAPGGVPTTTVGDAFQMSAAGVWALTSVGSALQPVEFPFSVQGSIAAVPEPATYGLIGLLSVGVTGVWYRSRRKKMAEADQSLRIGNR